MHDITKTQLFFGVFSELNVFFRNGSRVKIYEMFMAIDDMEWNIIYCSKYLSMWKKGICPLSLTRTTFDRQPKTVYQH